MFSIAGALLTERNLRPSSKLERVGDWFISPLAHFIGKNKFHVIKNGINKFAYRYAEEYKYISADNYFSASFYIAILFSPFALLGFAIKLPALATSNEMRDIYFDWIQPISGEYTYIAHGKQQERFLAQIWNNQSVIDGAIKSSCANLLMNDILKNPKQWFIRYQDDSFTKGYWGFGSAFMTLSPYITECVCRNSGNFDRHLTQRRQNVEKKLSDYVQTLNHSRHLTYMALGADGLLQELNNIYIFLSQGFDVECFLIDPAFENISLDKTSAKNTENFINLINAISRETNHRIHIQFLNNINEVPAGKKIDVISIIDFDDIKEHYDDVCKAYTYLRNGGRLYLSFDKYDFVYDEKQCIESSNNRMLPLVIESKLILSNELPKIEVSKNTPKSTAFVSQNRFSLFHELKEGYDLCIKDIGVIPLAASLCEELITRIRIKN